jgi:hypothetical protein
MAENGAFLSVFNDFDGKNACFCLGIIDFTIF